VHVTPRGESYVLAITAKAPTGPEAARLANAYATAALDERAKIVQGNVDANIRSLRSRLAELRRTGADHEQISDLAGRSEQLRALRALGTDPSLQLSQRAEVPAGPIGISRPILIALAVIGGLMLGSVAAVALEFFTRRIRDEDEIARLYPIPILAGIPKIRGRRRRRIDPQALPAATFEQVRLLRVQLPIGEIPTSIMITSANSGDGKTTTASALATAVALGEEDVILIDLDVRKSGTTGMFGIARPLYAPPHNVSSLEQMLVPVPGLPRLRVMPAPLGDALSLELFVRQLPDLLSDAKRMANCVIVDAAPIGEVSDTLRVAAACDWAVFVVRPRHTHRARFILTRDVLARAGITPLGIVVIGQRISGASQRYDVYKYTGVDALETFRGAPLDT
jgi:Mrp family chromosome partitioning ATPase